MKAPWSSFQLSTSYKKLILAVLAFGYTMLLSSQVYDDGIYGSTNIETHNASKNISSLKDSSLNQSFYITGSTLLLFNTLDVSYEWLFKNQSKPTNYNGLSASIGAFILVSPSLGLGTSSSIDNGIYVLPRYVFLKGKENKFFELNIGAAIGYQFSNDNSDTGITPFPDVGLGYRKITKRNNIFRIGFSLIKGVYLSLGSFN